MEKETEEPSNTGIDTTGLKVIALDLPNTLRSRLDCSTWCTTDKIKVMGELGENDFALLNGLAHDSITYIDLSDSRNNTLNDEVFAECHALEHLILPNTLKSIPDDMCVKCKSLTHIVVPNTIETINNYCFSECSNLSKFIIPEKVLYIGVHVFKGCNSLTKIYCESETPPECSIETLSDIADDCEIFVKKQHITNFLNHHIWRNFNIKDF